MSTSQRSTPTRAIPSALATKAAAAVPPADTVYTPLVKAILSQRLRRVFVKTLIFSWISSTVWLSWFRGGFGYLGVVGWLENWLSPVTVLVTLVAFAVGPLPVTLLRKQYLSSEPLLAPSPSATLKGALSKPGVLRILTVYLASALVSAFLHVIVAYSTQLEAHGDPKLTFFTTSRKHPYRLNGRFLFLVLSQTVLATCYFIRTVVSDRYCMKWPRGGDSSNYHHHSSPVNVILVVASGFALLCLTFASSIPAFIIFSFFRTLVHVFSSLPIIRPLAAHFSRGSYTPLLLWYHAGLIWRSLLVGFTTICGWELSEHLLAGALEEPIVIAKSTPQPAVALTSALSPSATPTGPTTASSLYFTHHALAELSNLTEESAQIRAAIYGDVGPGMKGNSGVWAVLVREALALVDKDYKTFLRRGAPEPKPATPPPPPKADAKAIPELVTPVSLIKNSPIYKPTPPSPVRALVDALGSDGTLSQAVDATVAPNMHLPDLFKSVSVAPPRAIVDLTKSISSIPTVASATLAATKQPGALMQSAAQQGASVVGERVLPTWGHEILRELGEWWTRPRVRRTAEASLPNRETDVLLVQVLTNLICASLKEDTYGIVQRDIPRVLEAFLNFLTAIEEYDAELRSQLPEPPSDRSGAEGALDKLGLKTMAENALKAHDIHEATEVVAIVGGALKKGISMIVRTFGDSMSAFKFSPRMSQKLQSFAV